MQDVFLTLPNGTIIRDRYVIEGLLGKGGFGSVYRVKDKRVKGNLFALKELIDPSKQERDRFTFECEVLRRLDHPSLPRVYHTFSDDATFRAYMLMDYIEGPNLEVLRQKQPQKRLPLSQVLSIMAPIIKAVSYLHSQQPPIIHRDVKPANIIVSTAGDEAVLVDFGIAKEYEPDSTTTTVRRCSPGYGAPEQYSSGTNIRTDIYGLGATFYALLTGVVPADAFYRMMQLGSKNADPLEPVSLLVPDIPAPVSAAIEKAMAINIDHRFETVEQFWQALQVYAGEPEAPETTSPMLQPVSLLTTGSPSPVTHGEKAEGDAPASEQLVVVSGEAHDEDATTVVTERKTLSPRVPTLSSADPKIAHLEKPPVSRGQRGIILGLILILLLASGGIAATFWLRGPQQHTSDAATRHASLVAQTPKHTPTLTSTVTSVPQNVPDLAGRYNGSMSTTTTFQQTSISIVLQQSQGSAAISGQVIFKPPSTGTDPFTGRVDGHGNFSFTIQLGNGQTPLYFYGALQPGGFLKGNYCSSSTNQCNQNTGYFNVGPRF